MIEPNEHLKLEKELLIDLEKSTSNLIASGVVIDSSGKKIVDGTYACVPIDAEIETLLSESVLWKYGVAPLGEVDDDSDYLRIFYIACAAFKLGRAYANILEKNYNKPDINT